MKVVLDTNVLISALLWKGKLAPLYCLINKKKIALCFSGFTRKEFKKVLHYPHILKQAKQGRLSVEEIYEKLISNSIQVSPKRVPNVIKEDPPDNQFLACALAARASFIVSGDEHLLKLKGFQGIPILTPREFLDRFK